MTIKFVCFFFASIKSSDAQPCPNLLILETTCDWDCSKCSSEYLGIDITMVALVIIILDKCVLIFVTGCRRWI